MSSEDVGEKSCCFNTSASEPVPPAPDSDSSLPVPLLRSEQIYSIILFVLGIMAGFTVKPSACADRINCRLRLASAPLWNTIANALKRIWYCTLLHLIGAKWGLREMFQKHRTFDMNDIPKRTGHVAVITGGARGIGLHVVKKLLECEMHVIIGCRNMVAGQTALAQLRTEGTQSGTAEVLELDLESLESVRSFASTILARPTPLHILINNAGIMFVPHKLTVDGLESHFQVNYLGHYLLSMLLLPKLKATTAGGSRKGRIVNVSSCAHYGGQVTLHDFSMKNFYSPYLGYMTSKFLQVLISNAMNSQNQKSVLINSVHPGIVQTELYQHVWWFHALRLLVKVLFKTPEQGADTILYAALSPELDASDGGQFIANSMLYAPKKNTNDPKLQELVLRVSDQLAGLQAVAVHSERKFEGLGNNNNG